MSKKQNIWILGERMDYIDGTVIKPLQRVSKRSWGTL